MNPVALITGGTRGIGLGIAEALAKEGYDLMLCGRRSPEAIQPTLDQLQKLGIEPHYVVADMGNPSQRHTLIEATRSHFNRLHVLVNNAGMAPRDRLDLLEATEASFEEVMRVNLQGPYFLTQAAAKWMIEQKKADAEFQGCIININSVSSVMASTNRGEYCISKAGLTMATKLWATRLGPEGIPVYEIAPGIIQTDMTAGVKEKYDRLIADGLLVQPRWGQAEDIGKAAAALARGDLGYATGQVLFVDGGLTLPRL